MTVHQLIYSSEMSHRWNDAEARRQVESILQASRLRNAANGLTGALTLAGDVFVQVLEGPLAAIETTFERICRDLRHKRVQVLEFAPGSRRVFGEWSMGQVTSTGELTRLCDVSEALGGARISPATAAVVVKTMRSLLTNPPLVGTAAEAREAAP